MSEPLPVSVVIPFYNGHADLPRALASIAAQATPPAEVVIVDDGSPEPLRADFRDAAIPTRVVRHERNRGIPGARNTGVAHATGEWIAFLDQDDAWLPDRLERQWRAVRARGDDARGTLFFSQMLTPGMERDLPWPAASRIRRMNRSADAALRLLLRHGNLVPLISILLHRSLLQRAGGFDERWRGGSDDYALVLALAARGAAFHGIARPLAVRHVTGRNYSDAARILADDLALIDALAAEHASVRDQARTARAAALLRCAVGLAHADPARARQCYDQALRERPLLLRARIGRALLRLHPRSIERILDLRRRVQQRLSRAPRD